MKVPRKEAAAAWSTVSRPDRIKVLELAAAGMQHPDRDIAKAAYLWSHSESWDSLTNRLPQWLLPLMSVIVGVLLAVLGVPLLALVLILPFIFGLLGWMTAHYASVIRRAYDSWPSPPVS